MLAKKKIKSILDKLLAKLESKLARATEIKLSSGENFSLFSISEAFKIGLISCMHVSSKIQ